MKRCISCNIYKSKSEFSRATKRLDGLQCSCKVCNAEYRKQNNQRILQYAKEYRVRNNDKIKSQLSAYRAIHKDTAIEYAKQWRRNNRGLRNAYEAKRKSSKLQCTPKWLNKKDVQAIKYLYQLAKILEAQTGYKWHVDHVIPLQGKQVCGLHVPENLQVIPAIKNLKKGLKFNGDDT